MTKESFCFILTTPLVSMYNFHGPLVNYELSTVDKSYTQMDPKLKGGSIGWSGRSRSSTLRFGVQKVQGTPSLCRRRFVSQDFCRIQLFVFPSVSSLLFLPLVSGDSLPLPRLPYSQKEQGKRWVQRGNWDRSRKER